MKTALIRKRLIIATLLFFTAGAFAEPLITKEKPFFGIPNLDKLSMEPFRVTSYIYQPGFMDPVDFDVIKLSETDYRFVALESFQGVFDCFKLDQQHEFDPQKLVISGSPPPKSMASEAMCQIRKGDYFNPETDHVAVLFDEKPQIGLYKFESVSGQFSLEKAIPLSEITRPVGMLYAFDNFFIIDYDSQAIVRVDTNGNIISRYNEFDKENTQIEWLGRIISGYVDKTGIAHMFVGNGNNELVYHLTTTASDPKINLSSKLVAIAKGQGNYYMNEALYIPGAGVIGISNFELYTKSDNDAGLHFFLWSKFNSSKFETHAQEGIIPKEKNAAPVYFRQAAGRFLVSYMGPRGFEVQSYIIKGATIDDPGQKSSKPRQDSDANDSATAALGIIQQINPKRPSIHWDRKTYEEITDECGHRLAYDPNDIEILCRQGNARLMHREYDGAANMDPETEVSFVRALELNPDYIPALVGTGDILLHFQKADSALAIFESAIAKDKSSSDAYRGKGDALYGLTRYDEALSAYKQAIFLDSLYARAWVGLGKTLGKLSKNEDEASALAKAVSYDPNDGFALSSYANCLAYGGKFDEALTFYSRATGLYPKLKIVWMDRGNALYSMGRFEESIGCFDKAIELDKNYIDAWEGKINSLQAMNKMDRTLEALKLYINPNLDGAMDWYRSLNRLDEALEALTLYIDSHPGNAAAWYYQARLCALTGQPSRAVNSLERAIRLDASMQESAKKEQDFNSLSDDEEFKRLLKDGPTKPSIIIYERGPNLIR